MQFFTVTSPKTRLSREGRLQGVKYTPLGGAKRNGRQAACESKVLDGSKTTKSANSGFDDFVIFVVIEKRQKL